MHGTIRVAEARSTAKELLSAVGLPQASFEADQIAGHVLGLSRSSLHAHPEQPLAEDDFAKIVTLSVRRAASEPLAYILGDALFCGRSFRVTRDTLIPRPETEVFAARIGDLMREKKTEDTPVFADWCTGGGCIVVTLLAENPKWRAYAVDSNERALSVAAENAALHGVLDRLELLPCSDPKEARGRIPLESLEFVTANPPYIPTKDIDGLEEQVRRYEPIEALDGGSDGLDIYRLLFGRLSPFMKPGAYLALETAGEEQGNAVHAMYEKSHADSTSKKFELIDFFPDQRNIYRFMLWKKKG